MMYSSQNSFESLGSVDLSDKLASAFDLLHPGRQHQPIMYVLANEASSGASPKMDPYICIRSGSGAQSAQ